MLPRLVPEIEYLETLNIEILRTPLRVDRVYKVKYRGGPHILQLELETMADSDMPYRLLDYHAYLLRKYRYPVISIIVYPFHTSIAESPLREMSGWEELLAFRFRVLRLWKLSAEQFVREHIVIMYAFLPTMQGANEALLKQAIDELIEYYKHDDTRLARELRWLGILLRRTETVPLDDKRKVQERLDMWDSLTEQDPKMKQIRAQSKAEGKAEGEAKGELKASQRMVLALIDVRFPSLIELAKRHVKQVKDPETLTQLAKQIAIAPDEDTARSILVSYAA